VILWGAHNINNPWACILALLILGVLVLRQMKQLAKAP
jgi:hypothetical protein